MTKKMSGNLSSKLDNLLGLDELSLEPIINQNINTTIKSITDSIDHNFLAQEGYLVSELQIGLDLINPNNINPQITVTLTRNENE